MRRRRPFRFFFPSFLSILIHLCILWGINAFLVPSRTIPDQPLPIPIQTVVIEEEKEEERLSRLASRETEAPKDAEAVKAQKTMGTPGPMPVEDFPGPIPKKGSFEPSLSAQQIPTPGVLPRGLKGQEAQSRRVVSPSTDALLQLPAARPSALAQPPLLKAEAPRVLTEAEEGGTPLSSMKMEKTSAPLGRNRPHPEFVSELPPIPTVESPILPEEGEMVLAESAATRPRAATTATLTPVSGSKKVGEEIRDNQWKKPVLKELASLEPLLGELEQRAAMVKAEQGFSMLLVLDTSGSVQGEPLQGIKRSAQGFVSLLGGADRCGVVTFNDMTTVLVPFTSNKAQLKRQISRLVVKGKNTVLFDALDKAFSLLSGEDRKRFVVLFSDGKDEGSGSTLEEVIEKAHRSQVAVFCVGYSRIERRHLKNLETISQRTGGIFAEAPHSREIVKLFRTARSSKAD